MFFEVFREGNLPEIFQISISANGKSRKKYIKGEYENSHILLRSAQKYGDEIQTDLKRGDNRPQLIKIQLNLVHIFNQSKTEAP